MAKKRRSKSNKSSLNNRISVLPRKHRTSFMLNVKEKEAIDSYCKKNKINNKSKFIRETLMQIVMQHFMDDYPTLFDKEDMDQLKIT